MKAQEEGTRKPPISKQEGNPPRLKKATSMTDE